jgi:hypothetical protein
MSKITISLSNHPSPLEQGILENPQTKTVSVEYLDDKEEIVREIEIFATSIKDYEDAVFKVSVIGEKGNTIVDGRVKDGIFTNGVFIS